MASVGVFELVAVTAGSLRANDVLCTVDVNDATQSAQGSLKKFLLSELYRTETTAVTVSTPLPDIRQTWNAGGVTFTAVKLNVTSTASAAGSLLLDLQVGGVSQFKVDKIGTVTTTGPLAIVGALTGATTGAFSSTVTVSAGGITVTGNSTITGTLTVSSTLAMSTNATVFQGKTSGGVVVSLLTLTADANNFTRYMAGVDAGGFQWTNQGQSVSWATLLAGVLTVASGLTVSAGGITVTGNSTITGTLGSLTGLTVASGTTAVQALTATTGAFSSTVSMTALTATTGTFTGLVLTPASTSGGAGFRIAQGSAPTTPTNGDIWFDGVNILYRKAGVTMTITAT